MHERFGLVEPEVIVLAQLDLECVDDVGTSFTHGDDDGQTAYANYAQANVEHVVGW